MAENSATDARVVVARMRQVEGSIGFNAARKAYVDVIDAGI
jgi:chaperonin GroEL